MEAPPPIYLPTANQNYAIAEINTVEVGLKPAPTKEFLGGYAEGVTPVPIPNTEVKPLRADGTARAAVWESRSPPGSNSLARLSSSGGLSCVR